MLLIIDESIAEKVPALNTPPPLPEAPAAVLPSMVTWLIDSDPALKIAPPSPVALAELPAVSDAIPPVSVTFERSTLAPDMMSKTRSFNPLASMVVVAVPMIVNALSSVMSKSPVAAASSPEPVIESVSVPAGSEIVSSSPLEFDSMIASRRLVNPSDASTTSLNVSTVMAASKFRCSRSSRNGRRRAQRFDARVRWTRFFLVKNLESICFVII
ncbi:hypothetical protein C2E31_11975 [Rhodopirellula baltica]|nr:hypothetical protein C2E31_11975 [Rhodopirellula baltica]